jgi:hypothetical protein
MKRERMSKRVAATILAMSAFGGFIPSAQATPVLQGTVAASAGVYPGCVGADCTSFRAQGCPEWMERADGLTASIIDATQVDGRTLTFTWSDATTSSYDAGLDATISRLYFYRLDSCLEGGGATGAITPWFALNTYPNGRTATVKIPVGTKWIIAEPLDNAATAVWSAH